MSQTLIPARGGRLVGACPVPRPTEGPPHIAVVVVDAVTGRAMSAQVLPEEGLLLASAIEQASRTLAPSLHNWIISQEQAAREVE